MEPRKNLQDLSSQNPCKNGGLLLHLVIYHDFHGLKLPYLLFISKIIIHEIRLCKEKHMLTNYFSCYKLNKTSTHPPFQEEKNSPKLKDCQIFYVISFGVLKHWCLLISKRKKVIFLIFLHMHSGNS